MSQAPLDSSHPDYAELAPLIATILQHGGGYDAFSSTVPVLLRQAFDEVIDAPRTNRFTLAEIEKTEKTYLGTKVEILLRNYLKLPKGKVLDMLVNGVEVDIKNTVGRTWMIPTESLDRPAFIIRANEKTARCDVGMVVFRREYLTMGENRDVKKTLAAAHNSAIWWLLRTHPYPPNFWEVLSTADRNEIMAAGGGKNRIAALFEKIQRQPISRLQVQALAQQHDYMKRIRRNGGARDVLAPKGIALLWGQGDRSTIKALKLGPVTADEFISFTPQTTEEKDLLRAGGHID